MPKCNQIRLRTVSLNLEYPLQGEASTVDGGNADNEVMETKVEHGSKIFMERGKSTNSCQCCCNNYKKPRTQASSEELKREQSPAARRHGRRRRRSSHRKLGTGAHYRIWQLGQCYSDWPEQYLGIQRSPITCLQLSLVNDILWSFVNEQPTQKNAIGNRTLMVADLSWFGK